MYSLFTHLFQYCYIFSRDPPSRKSVNFVDDVPESPVVDTSDEDFAKFLQPSVCESPASSEQVNNTSPLQPTQATENTPSMEEDDIFAKYLQPSDRQGKENSFFLIVP